MNPETYQSKLITLLEGAVVQFNSGIPGAESALLENVVGMLKELQVDQKGKIINNTFNLNRVSRIRMQLQNSVLSDKWKNSVKGLLKAFKSVETLQQEYFASLDPAFKQSPLLNTITAGAVDITIRSLTEEGIGSQVISKIDSILRQNIISQVSYSDLVESMRTYLKSTGDGLSLLSQYAQRFVTDALNQYSASYTQTVAQDLGFQWYMYSGSLLTTSRPWCEHMVKKKYIHQSEFATVLKGHFDDEDVPLNKRTGLPEGMMPDTTVENLPVKRGGYNCGHQFTPVHESVVPPNLRMKSQIVYKHFNDPGKITINIGSLAQSALKKLNYSVDEILRLAGGLPIQGLNAKYEIRGNDKSIIVYSENSEYKIERTIYPDQNYIENYIMKVFKSKQGTGLDLFLNQVKQARMLGYDRLEVYALNAPGWNGYETWAKFGYIMKPDSQRQFNMLMKENGRAEKSVFELVQTDEGKSFWKENGFSFYGEFDLHDNSQAMKNLLEYLRKKGIVTQL